MSRGAGAALLVAGLLACSCRGDSKAAGAGEGPVRDAARTSAVTLLVDGQEVSRMSLAPAETSLPLGDWLSAEQADPSAWAQLTARGSGGRTFSVKEPSAQYPDSEARLYRDDEGHLSLGLFRAGVRDPVAGLRHIDSIAIGTAPARRTGSQRGGLASPIVIEVVDGDRVAISEAALAALPDRQLPGAKGTAWALLDLLRAAVGERRPVAVALVRPDGSAETLDVDLTGAGNRRILVKQNRRGQLRVQSWRVDGERAQREKTWRDVDRFRVELAPGESR